MLYKIVISRCCSAQHLIAKRQSEVKQFPRLLPLLSRDSSSCAGPRTAPNNCGNLELTGASAKLSLKRSGSSRHSGTNHKASAVIAIGRLCRGNGGSTRGHSTMRTQATGYGSALCVG